MCPSKWWLVILLVLLHCATLAYSQYYRQLYNRRRGNGESDRARTTSPFPPAADSATGRANPADSGPIPRAQYYQRLVSKVRGDRGLKLNGEFSPSVPTSPSQSSSSADFARLAEIAAMVPPGGTVRDLPKSQLAVLSGDLEYTRFRQLFLREMCQKLLNGPRSELFQFCFSILAL